MSNVPYKSQLLIYQSDDGTIKIDVRFENETVWLTQPLMAELFQTTQQNISLHLQNIYEEGELGLEATHKKILSVRREGNRDVQRQLDFYNLDAIISVGYRVKSRVATQFRIWATQRLREYIVKGFVLPDGSLFGEGVKTRLKEQLLEECKLHTIVRLPNSVFKPYASIGTNLLFFEKGEPTKDIWFYEHRVPEGQKAYSMTKPIRIEHLKPCADWWGSTKRKGRVENEVAWRVTAEEVKARGYNLDFKNPHTVADDHGDSEELLAKLDEAEKQAAALRDQLKAVLAEALLR